MNGVLVAEVMPLDVATRVSVPLELMERLEKVATPLTVVTVNVPKSVPEPVLMAIATDAGDVVTTAPDASSTDTTTEGVIVERRALLEGWVVKTRWVVGPVDVGEKLELVDGVRLPELTISV
ncbi:MAG TPA: hypothetical protein VIJ86_08350 [Acidimicrobiales bacterium]